MDYEGDMEFLGKVDSSRNVLKSVNFCFLLQKGTPRSTLEALARPIITTNVPGCRNRCE